LKIIFRTFHDLGSVTRRYQKGADIGPPSRIRLEGPVARQANAIIATCTDEVTETEAVREPPVAVASRPAVAADSV
jgi:D-inositol-3-phosphate glycosyltransferase